jgi:hypothetical protein
VIQVLSVHGKHMSVGAEHEVDFLNLLLLCIHTVL